MSADEYISSLRPDMEKAMDAMKRELASVRTCLLYTSDAADE